MEVNPRRVEQQIRNFQRAIDAYDYTEPFARFLTKFFRGNKQMGASDRRMTSRLCYNLFRLGRALEDLPIIQRLSAAEFLCETESAVVELYQPRWASRITNPLEDKVQFLEENGYAIKEHLFAFTNRLSLGIDQKEFELSHLIQPDLFIRVRQGHGALVEQLLRGNSIHFEKVFGQAYRLQNGSKLQEIKYLYGLYEVQDLSSQESIIDVHPAKGERWWDVCAGAGGKSLLLLDRCPSIDLLVSDIRMSILRNLDERFEKAKVTTRYRKKVLDLTKDVGHLMAGETFDAILVDAPCSGSGTWGRTPEVINSFEEERLLSFVELQRQIVDNVVPYLKPGGVLLYITCSVFEAENEQIVRYMKEQHGLEVESEKVIIGYNRKSDNLFTAQLRKGVN